MKNKQKIIFCSLSFILVVTLAFIGYGFVSEQNNAKKLGSNDTTTKSENKEQTILNVTSSFELLHDLSNAGVMYNLSDYIAIIKIDSIDGFSNINKVSNEYISNPYTYGEASVLYTLKGNINQSKIDFVRTGGVLPYDEWIKGDVDPDKLEYVREENGLGNTPTNNIFINYSVEDDITIEEGKIYLAYMSHDSDFNTNNEYTIQGFQFGLREVQQTNTSAYSTNSIQNINIKNNVTGQWEKLSQIVNLNVSE